MPATSRNWRYCNNRRSLSKMSKNKRKRKKSLDVPNVRQTNWKHV